MKKPSAAKRSDLPTCPRCRRPLRQKKGPQGSTRCDDVIRPLECKALETKHAAEARGLVGVGTLSSVLCRAGVAELLETYTVPGNKVERALAAWWAPRWAKEVAKLRSFYDGGLEQPLATARQRIDWIKAIAFGDAKERRDAISEATATCRTPDAMSQLHAVLVAAPRMPAPLDPAAQVERHRQVAERREAERRAARERRSA